MKTGIGRKEDTGSEMKAGWTPPPKSFFPLFPDKGSGFCQRIIFRENQELVKASMDAEQTETKIIFSSEKRGFFSHN